MCFAPLELLIWSRLFNSINILSSWDLTITKKAPEKRNIYRNSSNTSKKRVPEERNIYRTIYTIIKGSSGA